MNRDDKQATFVNFGSNLNQECESKCGNDKSDLNSNSNSKSGINDTINVGFDSTEALL